MSKDKQYFWNDTGGNFGGRRAGEDVTDFLVIDGTPDKKRINKMLELGQISETKPDSHEQASSAELIQLRKTVNDQKIKIADLEDELSKVPKNVTAARKESKELKAELVEKDIELTEKLDEITKLKADLEEATKPEGK